MRAAILGLLFLCACKSQDAIDQAHVRRHCLLPADAAPYAWKGADPGGFGQREGLSVYGTFRLSKAARGDFERRAAAAKWAPLPMPGDERTRIETFVRNDLLSKTFGLYSCRTAGDNVLAGTATTPCMDVAKQSDIVVCVYDRATGEVFTAVAARY